MILVVRCYFGVLLLFAFKVGLNLVFGCAFFFDVAFSDLCVWGFDLVPVCVVGFWFGFMYFVIWSCSGVVLVASYGVWVGIAGNCCGIVRFGFWIGVVLELVVLGLGFVFCVIVWFGVVVFCWLIVLCLGNFGSGLVFGIIRQNFVELFCFLGFCLGVYFRNLDVLMVWFCFGYC